jgi:thiol-disulfide isomerase/thioredoxin
MRRSTAILLAAAALAGCGSDEPPKSAAPSPADTRRSLAGAPPPLAAIHRQANRLLPGGEAAFERRLRELRGHPVVVNKWASWCPPCRAEFPFFQRLGTELGARVPFLGVDSEDNAGDAASFLERYPVPYPSYDDPEQRVARVFKGHLAFPTTAFYDRRGKLRFVHQGGYATEARLREDVERYALAR